MRREEVVVGFIEAMNSFYSLRGLLSSVMPNS